MVQSSYLLATSLIASMAVAKRNILTQNTWDWNYSNTNLSLANHHHKNWYLTGQTGWVRDPETKELVIDLAFILNTTDDGVPPTEKIVDDDIINISWAIYTN